MGGSFTEGRDEEREEEREEKREEEREEEHEDLIWLRRKMHETRVRESCCVHVDVLMYMHEHI